MSKRKTVWEIITYGKEEAKRRERVRKRRSYLFFRKLAKLFYERDLKGLLEEIYEEIDRKHGWGSVTNSKYASESLTLLLKDIGELENE